jgi:hypothetical protein
MTEKSMPGTGSKRPDRAIAQVVKNDPVTEPIEAVTAPMDAILPDAPAASDGGVNFGPAEQVLAADLRAAFLVEPSPEVAERHIAAMVVARQAKIAGLSGPGVASLAAHRSRKAVAALGIAGAVLIGSAGVAAASGDLPGPLQHFAVSLGRPLGIDLPSSGGSTSGSPVPPAGSEEPTTTVGSSATGGSGEAGQSDPTPSTTPGTPGPDDRSTTVTSEGQADKGHDTPTTGAGDHPSSDGKVGSKGGGDRRPGDGSGDGGSRGDGGRH